jgi:L-threonylcarbamoyladenylate synthase
MRYIGAAEAAQILRKGGVGLVPTETVVGLVAGEAGLWRLFEIKHRDAGKPIALLCGSTKEALALSREVPPLASFLAGRFWPGPLTLVLNSGKGETVGVRVPAHPSIQAVLAGYGGPLYATSANPSGEPAPRALEEVEPALHEAVDFAVWGEPGSGEASAVVDLSGGRIQVLRPTEKLTQERLAQLVPEAVAKGESSARHREESERFEGPAGNVYTPLRSSGGARKRATREDSNAEPQVPGVKLGIAHQDIPVARATAHET